MQNILLICKDGISSKFLADSAAVFIESYNASINFITTDVDNYTSELNQDLSLILIAPQAEFKDNAIKEIDTDEVPVKTIPDDVYGWANGERLVKFVMDELNLKRGEDATV